MNLLTSLEATSPARLLPPCAETVLALAERLRWPSRTPLASDLARDPGAAVIWWQLSGEQGAENDGEAGSIRRLLDSFLASAATPQFADWSAPPARALYQIAMKASELAGELALLLGQPTEEPRQGAPFLLLGHFIQAQNPEHFADQNPFALTRQLARRWRWPAWLRECLLQVHADRWPPAVANLRLALAGLVLAAEARPDAGVRLGISAKAVCDTLGMSGSQRGALEARLREWAVPPAALSAEASQLLVRALRLSPPAEPSAAAVLVRDLEEDLERSQARIHELESAQSEALRDQKLEALAEFAAGAAHEINNPLAVISAQAQHLLKSEESLERARALERIIGQSQRIHHLLRDLMLYARPPEPKPRSVRLDQLLAEACRRAAELANTREVTLQRSRLAGLRVKVDPDLVANALACLVQNAVAAAPAGGWVKVGLAEQQADGLTLVVEDNGPGLPLPLQQRLFDPFFSGRSAGRGVGLGLPKAWRIAQLHGGRLFLESQPGQPTRFFFSLPAESAPPRSAAPRHGARKSSSRLRPAARRRR